ncbi:hypothetical protein [Streptococcus pyogenes]|uniref:hypothetical protein n=1 Tax=Streptococcus pyogenes TaxID=1314 RepID=UPI00109BD47A|nr:hypothetical protein [Streptococcus pyogenes]VGQ27180.1 hypothetical membrane associated protein [Streptococcus pyogenes]VGV58143.1 Uncharacterised protein [Streptococcus pyogenes]VGV80890.1 Uncharacterised protein [Streptococcus pyogenes]VHB04541.1 Uncharacterised protein [Streptococcus pyogenes]VHB43002.1 Uncharacterised protein [Streptococcus pyogenes]
MKTKSKRFLNLATLCLALLGTTLLTTQPVKAEIVKSPEAEQTVMQKNGVTETGDDNSYQKEWDRGYDEGYKKGNERNSPKKPEHPPVADGSGYSDGYSTGYGAGWYDGHLVEAIIDGLISWFNYIFFG